MEDNFKKVTQDYCKNPRSYGSYDNQSAFTFQRSVPSISFPKSPRFSSTIKIKKYIDPSFSTLSSSLILNDSSLRTIGESIIFSKGQNIKGASIGFGNRTNLSKIDNSPGPASVLLPSTLNKRSVIMGSRIKNENTFITPEPGHYNINNTNDTKKILTSLTDRHGFYYEDNIKYSSKLGPGQYTSKDITNGRYKKIGIGYGKKSFFSIRKFVYIKYIDKKIPLAQARIIFHHILD